MAAVAGMFAKSMAKGMAKSAARKVRSEAEDFKKEAISKARNMANDLKNQARARATNYLDAQKHRIYETARGAVYTNTSGGNRNYRPTPVYRNVPGSNVITPVNRVPQMFNRQ
jgi:hypothetical protein